MAATKKQQTIPTLARLASVDGISKKTAERLISRCRQRLGDKERHIQRSEFIQAGLSLGVDEEVLVEAARKAGWPKTRIKNVRWQGRYADEHIEELGGKWDAAADWWKDQTS